MLKSLTIQKNLCYRVFNENESFMAEIVMNPRDETCFAYISALPDDKEQEKIILNAFLELFKDQYQGNSCFRIAPHLSSHLPLNFIQVDEPDVVYINPKTAARKINEIKDSKQAIVTHIEECLAGTHFTFIKKDKLQSRTEELSRFKILYAGFINQEKIKTGKYSDKAEKEKLNNPLVEHYAIENIQNHHLVCYLMVTVHCDLAYCADLIVHPAYRHSGWAQTLLILAFQEIIHAYPYLNGIWGRLSEISTREVETKLYGSIFEALFFKENPSIQQDLGIFIQNAKPGKKLLIAANRDLETWESLDEAHYIEDALKLLASTQESTSSLISSSPQSPLPLVHLFFTPNQPCVNMQVEQEQAEAARQHLNL